MKIEEPRFMIEESSQDLKLVDDIIRTWGMREKEKPKLTLLGGGVSQTSQ